MRARIITACGCWRDVDDVPEDAREIRRAILRTEPNKFGDAGGSVTIASTRLPPLPRVFRLTGRGKSGVLEYHEVVE